MTGQDSARSLVDLVADAIADSLDNSMRDIIYYDRDDVRRAAQAAIQAVDDYYAEDA